MREYRKYARTAFLFIFIAAAGFAGGVRPAFSATIPGTAALQKHAKEFVETLLTYETPHSTEGLFTAERYMAPSIDGVWREWRDKWLENAHFARAASMASVKRVLVNPSIGANGDIRVRAIVETHTAMLGKTYQSSGTVYVTFSPQSEEGEYAVSYVLHESDGGGVFEISPSGVRTRSALPEGTFDRLLMDSSS